MRQIMALKVRALRREPGPWQGSQSQLAWFGEVPTVAIDRLRPSDIVASF